MSETPQYVFLIFKNTIHEQRTFLVHVCLWTNTFTEKSVDSVIHFMCYTDCTTILCCELKEFKMQLTFLCLPLNDFSFNELSFFNKVFFIITDKNHIVSQNHGTANKSFVQWKCCINLFYVTTFSNDLHVGVRKQWYDQIYEHSLKMIKFILLNHKNEYTCTVHVFVFMHIMRQHTTKVLKRHPPPPKMFFHLCLFISEEYTGTSNQKE